MIRSTTDRRKLATVLPIVISVLLTYGLFASKTALKNARAQDESRLTPPAQSVLQKPNQEELPQGVKQDDPQDQNGRQILMRGPMHEAFVELHSVDPKPNAYVDKKPPEPIKEVPPEFKPEGDNVRWIPGYWAWEVDKKDFIWVSGIWRDIPPKQAWIPGYWEESDKGYRWISGFWHEEEKEELQYLPEPPESIDSGPSTPPPSDDHFYVPGNWIMQGQQYQWTPGFWKPIVEDWILFRPAMSGLLTDVYSGPDTGIA